MGEQRPGIIVTPQRTTTPDHRASLGDLPLMPDTGSDRQPFDQRYMAFVLLSFCILMLLNPWGQPPVDQPPADGGAAVNALAEADPPAGNAGQEDAAADQEADAGETAEAIAEEPAAAAQRVALGSLAEDGSFRMLATLTNTGAAVERIELASSDFRDLDDRAGYLGDMGLEPTQGGVRVTVVGAGTPAAAAGIQVGDVITSVSSTTLEKPGKFNREIESQAGLNELLSKTKPGKQVTLAVQRSGNSLDVDATLARRPLALIRPEAENILLHRTELPTDFEPATSYRLTLDRVGDLRTDSVDLIAANRALQEETWTIVSSSTSEVVFRKRLPKLRLEIIKRFALPEIPEGKRDDHSNPDYHLDLKVEVANLADTPQSVAYTIEGPNGLPIEGWWYSNKVGRSFGRYGIRDILAHYYGSSVNQFACSEVVNDEVAPMGQGASMAYIGIDAQYFAAALLPVKASSTDVQFSVAKTKLATPVLLDEKNNDNRDLIFNNPTFTVTTQGVDIPAGATTDDEYTLFAGPKRPELLASYFTAGDANYSLTGFSYYGWFGAIAKIMLGILHLFYAGVGNYGLAIVMLTVLVRGCMVPISLKQAKNMAMMQKLKPEMDRIAQKYKDDRQKQAQAQSELFRKHNYNPLGGCLPMFLQLPIFLGLYRALAVDVELRQAPLISESIRWCSNLAAPDMFIRWSSWTPQWFDNGQGMFALGPFLNILPIATVCLFLAQQKMFMPEPTNEQMVMQQKIMKYMMGFMALMFFKVASGLCIYFIASSLWGMAERKLIPKPEGVAPATSSTPSSSPKKSSGGGNNAKAAAKRKNKKKRK